MVAAVFLLLVLSSTIYVWVLVENRKPNILMGTLALFGQDETTAVDLTVHPNKF
jgi:hypothetical protein